MSYTFRSLCTLLVLVSFLRPVSAEHRVALLIGNSNYDNRDFSTPARDLNQIAASLKKYGVRCIVRENLSGANLKSALESFAASTPVRGTAIVWFSGQILPGNSKGKNGSFLVGIDAKKNDAREVGRTGYGIETLLETMSKNGGSSNNLVLIDAAKQIPELKSSLAPECLLARVSAKAFTEKLTGTGDLPGEVRSASVWSKSTLDSDIKITGKGSSVIAPPDKFVEGRKAGEEWVNAQGVVFCWCPAGSYLMGSPESETGRYPDEKQRKVELEKGFWISKYELTLRENRRNHPRGTLATHKNHPLTMIQHNDITRMATKDITNTERNAGRLPKDWQYSLPTEEQWEYAARAGTTTRFSFGEDEGLLPKHANFGDKSYYDSKDVFSNSAHRSLNDGVVRLAIVGSYEPNPWGIHDVHGNVAEWCVNKAIRGGSWASVVSSCRCAYRDFFSERDEQNFIGYRLVIQRTNANR